MVILYLISLCTTKCGAPSERNTKCRNLHSDHALRQFFAPPTRSTFLRIREIVQRARDDDGERESDCENDLVRGNRCDDASTAILGPQLPPARFQLAHTMPKTEPAQSPSFSSRRIATRLLIQMEVVLVAAACCRARKPPLKDGRTEGRTDCDRERCSLPPPPPLFLSALYIHPMLLHLTHSVPSSSSSSSLLFVPSLLLKCELNAFSLQSRRPTDRPRE